MPANSSQSDTQPTQPTNGSVGEAPSDVPAPSMPPVCDLPPNVLDRVQRLKCQTVLHIPKQFCQQMCRIIAECVEGGNAGDATAAIYEQARSKLLLACFPKGSITAFEWRARLGLRNAGSIVTLLDGIEEQVKATPGSRGRARPLGEQACKIVLGWRLL